MVVDIVYGADGKFQTRINKSATIEAIVETLLTELGQDGQLCIYDHWAIIVKPWEGEGNAKKDRTPDQEQWSLATSEGNSEEKLYVH